MCSGAMNKNSNKAQLILTLTTSIVSGEPWHSHSQGLIRAITVCIHDV